MKLTTSVDIQPFPFKLAYSDKSVWLGSCFANELGQLMVRMGFSAEVNPFGAHYNPLSLAQSIHLLLNNKALTDNDLFEHQGLWHSFHYHSHFSASTPDRALAKMNERQNLAHQQIIEADYLFLTLGTAYAYQLSGTETVVNNCHKLPAQHFDRVALSPAICVKQISVALEALWQRNPRIRIVFTVSPIRHLRDGLHNNQLSKARLLLVIDELLQTFPEHCFYFPAYEILLDELRDYRFYADDLCHPSSLAIQYIWERFKETLIQPAAYELMRKSWKAWLASQHVINYEL